MSDTNPNQSVPELSINAILQAVREKNLHHDLNAEVTDAIRNDILVAFSDKSTAELESGGIIDTGAVLAEMYRRCDGGHSDLMLIIGVEEVIRHFASTHHLAIP